MVRKRVLSFMSHFSSDHNRNSYTTTPPSAPSTASPASGRARAKSLINRLPVSTPSTTTTTTKRLSSADLEATQPPADLTTPSPPAPSSPPAWDGREQPPASADPSPTDTINNTRTNRGRSNSRPLSMVFTYQPPTMDISEDTIPELQPIFSFLNSHGNKLYQEGYFLKLDDQNTQGKPNPDRTWTECFAQLVGTVLSLWDAAELDAAGEDGEVLPKFINLTDASIKMIESLPTSSAGEQPLQNILSISTAGKNRYLLHFNSKHSLIQWTAGIRLAMFEHATLQEAYTGALLAGKGKMLNNIGVIMERSRMPVEQWVRVRFGAGMPWRRCWCVISPPDEKEYQKMQKEVKKKGPYDRTRAPVLKGDIKFYDQRKEGKKQKKMQPIATMNDAYSAYALYPQAKSLIDASTLIKLEGSITIHSDPPSSTEGFVFIMPEVNPAISGFEMMMRFLFPTWDTYGLYGRPGRLVTSVLDQRSLMFAMPKHKRYGYLELLDVSSLILTEGSSSWNEKDWRKKLKELTSTRMNVAGEERETESGPSSRSNSRAGSRMSGGTPQPGQRQRVGFADPSEQPALSNRASRSMSLTSRPTDISGSSSERAASAMGMSHARHSRNISDPSILGQLPHHPAPHQPSPLSGRPPASAQGFAHHDLASTPERASSEDDAQFHPHHLQPHHNMGTPEPVIRPPGFSHRPNEKPTTRPYHSPELRRANSRLSSTTLAQLAQNGGVALNGGEQAPMPPPHHDQAGPSPGLPQINHPGMPANAGPEAMRSASRSPGLPPPGVDFQQNRSQSPMSPNRGPGTPNPNFRRPSPGDSRPSTASSAGQPRGPGGPPGGGPGGGPYPGPPGRGGPPPGYRGRGGPGPGRGRGMPPPHMGPPGNPNVPPGSNMYRQQRGPPGSEEPLHLNTVIARKPLVNGSVPARKDSLTSPRDVVPPAQSSASSFTSASIDSSIMNKIQGPPQGDRPAMRRNDTTQSGVSSRYDDNASTASPDYASTRPSIDTQASAERPRAGVLKTVGHTGSPAEDSYRREFDMPEIDFGPTLNYAAQQGSKAPAGVTSAPHHAPHNATQPASSAASSQSFAPSAGPQRRSPAPQAVNESTENARRSIIWQPPSASPHSINYGGSGMSAEQFVQQRAAPTPVYAHQRHSSGANISGYGQGTPTPPLNHAASHDYPGIGHKRHSSQELLQRPGSRGAGAVLGGQGESHLSAREQEQIARATGAPLIQVQGNRGSPGPNAGLVGAIQTREREREQARQGWSNQSTQQAIQQRQQAQQQMYQQQYQPPGTPRGGPPPTNGYATMGRGMGYGGPQSPMVPQSPMMPQSPMQQGYGMQQQQQGYFPASPGGYEQSGQWGGGGRAMSPQMQQQGFSGRQTPVMQGNQYQAQQYAPGPQQGQQHPGQDQGSYGHHGQAF